MPIVEVQGLFAYELGVIYDAEYRFLDGQQEMAQEATDQDLEKAIREHIEQTRLHIRNLEQVFELLGGKPQRQTSHVAQWLVNEAQQSIQQARNDAIRDCAINAAVIKVEHFEMGSYRTMFTGAQLMGHTEIAELLEQNMRQEEEAARIAERSAGELLRKAQQAEKQEEEGLTDRARGKLPSLNALETRQRRQEFMRVLQDALGRLWRQGADRIERTYVEELGQRVGMNPPQAREAFMDFRDNVWEGEVVESDEDPGWDAVVLKNVPSTGLAKGTGPI